MKITEQQILFLIDITTQVVEKDICKDEKSRENIKNVLMQIRNQQSNELREVE